MPLQNTSGNDTTDAYGGGVVAVIPNYIENVFSTYLYTGTGASQSIVNGIDLSTKGGLVWLKPRSSTTYQDHLLFDTARGASHFLFSNSTMAELVVGGVLTAFNANGFDLGSSVRVNASGVSNVAWTFRKQPKFFDVVTYTGTGSNTTVAHNLGSVPGCIIVKRTDTAGDWQVYHNSLTSAAYSIQLDLTNAQASTPTVWNSTAPTSTVFSVGTNADVNASGGTYVAYIYAHNAGGFGLTGTDNVISCGSYTGTGAAGNFVSLGWEPQYVMIKDASSTYGWYIQDVMRGMSNTGEEFLFANTSGAATNSPANYITPNATGFTVNSGASGLNASGDSYIYIAIRRGPMKVPTDATKVYNVISQTPSGTTTLTNSFASDMVLSCQRSNAGGWGFNVADKLRGSSIASGSPYLTTPTTAAEGNLGAGYGFTLTNTNVQENFWNSALGISTPVVYNIFQRAPSFFDEVCYTGNGSGQNITHNLGVAPQLLIVKRRSAAGTSWATWATSLTADQSLALNTTDDKNAVFSVGFWGSTFPTSSVFTVGSNVNTNSAVTYVAYLFATCAGVSNVGTYTGNGSTQAIACGFTGGARFVLIKRTDATGNWYVYDTARGMTTLTDPYLLLNSTAAESATLGSVTTTTGGFTVNEAILTGINTSSATYIFLAIA